MFFIFKGGHCPAFGWTTVCSLIPADGQLGSHPSAVVNDGAVNLGVHTSVAVLLGVHMPEGELLGRVVILCLSFCGSRRTVLQSFKLSVGRTSYVSGNSVPSVSPTYSLTFGCSRGTDSGNSSSPVSGCHKSATD